VTSKLSVREVRRRRRSPGWGFVAPYLVLLFAFVIVPAIYGLYQAFIVTSVVGPSRFSITKNFIDVLTIRHLLDDVAKLGPALNNLPMPKQANIAARRRSVRRDPQDLQGDTGRSTDIRIRYIA
jgi:ABC-type sugar transport system permease subunit